MISIPAQRTRRTFTFILVACVFVSLAFVGFPMYVIRPFRTQGPRELAVALVVARFRPMVTLLSAIAILGTLLWYWREETRKWRRVMVAVGAGLVCLLAVAARINVFELMFHPIGHPSFAAATQVKLDKDEKVIAVKSGSIARAYPIRVLAYHHMINDVVGGVAIIATY